MAPSRAQVKAKKSSRSRPASKKSTKKSSEIVNVRHVIQKATTKLEQGDPMGAARIARTACEHMIDGGRNSGAILALMGQIQVELGEMDEARSFFLKAVGADKDRDQGEQGLGDSIVDEEMGVGVSEKYLWLAQLSEEGGRDSASWYERGAAVLRRQIQALTDGLASRPHSQGQQKALVDEKKRKLAEVLCAVAELYMTDLSWEADAEQRCEALVTESTMLAPDLADTWQTVANVRISQSRTEDARTALDRSIELWAGLPPEDAGVPAFPTRVSLVRLLIEVGREETAIDVADRLIAEDDTSVEVWYLGGVASFNLGERLKDDKSKDNTGEWHAAWKSARKWLKQCLALYAAEDYEDDRLGEHAAELLSQVDKELGDAADGEDNDDVWEDEDGDGDRDGDGDEDME